MRHSKIFKEKNKDELYIRTRRLDVCKFWMKADREFVDHYFQFHSAFYDSIMYGDESEEPKTFQGWLAGTPDQGAHSTLGNVGQTTAQGSPEFVLRIVHRSSM